MVHLIATTGQDIGAPYHREKLTSFLMEERFTPTCPVPCPVPGLLVPVALSRAVLGLQSVSGLERKEGPDDIREPQYTSHMEHQHLMLSDSAVLQVSFGMSPLSVA